MARPGDQGSYAVGNVKIITGSENLSEANLGRRPSEETRAKLRDAKRASFRNDPSYRLRISAGVHRAHQNDPSLGLRTGAANRGKPLSEATKRKISAAHLGMKHTKETKRRMSEAQRGRKAHRGDQTED